MCRLVSTPLRPCRGRLLGGCFASGVAPRDVPPTAAAQPAPTPPCRAMPQPPSESQFLWHHDTVQRPAAARATATPLRQTFAEHSVPSANRRVCVSFPCLITHQCPAHRSTRCRQLLQQQLACTSRRRPAPASWPAPAACRPSSHLLSLCSRRPAAATLFPSLPRANLFTTHPSATAHFIGLATTQTRRAGRRCLTAHGRQRTPRCQAIAGPPPHLLLLALPYCSPKSSPKPVTHEW